MFRSEVRDLLRSLCAPAASAALSPPPSVRHNNPQLQRQQRQQQQSMSMSFEACKKVWEIYGSPLFISRLGTRDTAPGWGIFEAHKNGV